MLAWIEMPRSSRGRLRPIHQLDQRHRRVVAYAESELENAQITAGALGVARTEFVEELVHGVLVAEAIERDPAVGKRRFFGQRDQRLGDAAQLLRFGQRGADRFVRQKRVGHVPQHRQPMAGGAVQFAETVTMTHGSFPFRAGRDWAAASSRASSPARARPRRELP